MADPRPGLIPADYVLPQDGLLPSTIYGGLAYYPTVADFGGLVLETDVDKAVILTLGKWFPHYLRAFEKERGITLGKYPRPKHRSFANTLDDDEFPDNLLPAVIVTSAQTDTPPTKDGDGNYSAEYTVRVSTVVRGQKPTETRDNASIYSAIVRRILVQQPDLDGFASECVWNAPSRLLPVADRLNSGRYLAAGSNVFTVIVENVLSAQGGPWTPQPGQGQGPYTPPDPNDPDQDYGLPTQVDRVQVDVVGVPINEEVGD